MLNKTVETAKKVMQVNIDFLQDVITWLDEPSNLEKERAICTAYCLAMYIHDRLRDESKNLYEEITHEK